MSEVDQAWASNRARELADELVAACHRPEHRDSERALLRWAMEFKRQFHAYTQPTSIDPAARAAAHAARYPDY